VSVPGQEELREALDDYVEQANASEKVQRTLGNWRCRVHFISSDSEASFTMDIGGGRIESASDGLEGEPELVVEGPGTQLEDIFWGEANPAELYNRGAIAVRGPQDHLMRLDAIAMIVFLGG
jgi:hypothetical protein